MKPHASQRQWDGAPPQLLRASLTLAASSSTVMRPSLFRSSEEQVAKLAVPSVMSTPATNSLAVITPSPSQSPGQRGGEAVGNGGMVGVSVCVRVWVGSGLGVCVAVSVGVAVSV